MSRNIDWLKARPIAHRGLHDESRGIVENTRTAFARAIAGNYAIECDLQISGDGEAMMFHDPNLDRLTEQDGAVNNLTAAQLKKVKFKNTDDRMQTFEEFLHQLNGQVPAVIELKSLVDGDMRLGERAIECLSNYKGRHCLMSFGPMLVRAIKDISPQTLRGGVVSPDTEHLWLRSVDDDETGSTILELADPDFVSYDVRGLPSSFVKAFRTSHKPAICWTIRDQKTADFAYTQCDQITFEGFTPK